MKKHNFLSKALSLALMLVMLVSLASIGVSATPILEIFSPLPDFSYGLGDYYVENDHDIIVNASDFEKYIQPYEGEDRDITLELAGVKLGDSDGPWANLGDSVFIPKMPPMDTPEFDAWVDAYSDFIISAEYAEYDDNGNIIGWTTTFTWEEMPIQIVYKMHKHNLQGSQMYFDDNYHWQLCAECANRVYLSNHTDRDNDGKCDFCGNAIRYYNVTVKETTGGKVTLSANKAAMNGKIGVTVTPDAGYHLEALNFVNANALHSKRAVWEDTPNAEYHFFVANWDVEVEAIFVKD